MSISVSEINLNIELARLLCERGLIGAGELLIKKLGQLKKPDVMIWLNGLKIIIEGKLGKTSAKSLLENDCEKRINEGLCEIAIGIIYNSKIFQNKIFFNQFEISKILENSNFQVKVWHISEIGSKALYDEWLPMKINDLSRVIKEVESNVVSNDFLKQNIENLSESIDSFSDIMKKI